MTEIAAMARNNRRAIESSSQPKGATKAVDGVSVVKVQNNDELPFDEREVLMSSNGTSTGQFFSHSDNNEEVDESRTGPSSDVSVRTTTIVATTATDLITTIKANVSSDQRQDEGGSSSETTVKSRKVGIGEFIQKRRELTMQPTSEYNDSVIAMTSPISELDDVIALVREGSTNAITDQEPGPDPDCMDLDDEVARIREGPPLSPIREAKQDPIALDHDIFQVREGEKPISQIQEAKPDTVALDDEIFQVREGEKPKSALKQVTATASKRVRFFFRPKTEAPNSDDIELNRKIDINTLVDIDDDDDDDDEVEESTQASSELATAFLNDLQKNSVDFDYLDAADEHSVETYDSTNTDDTDGQSITLYDCWELACV